VRRRRMLGAAVRHDESRSGSRILAGPTIEGGLSVVRG
jgi:hypothetical protein